jgi:hypothetical protein
MVQPLHSPHYSIHTIYITERQFSLIIFKNTFFNSRFQNSDGSLYGQNLLWALPLRPQCRYLKTQQYLSLRIMTAFPIFHINSHRIECLRSSTIREFCGNIFLVTKALRYLYFPIKGTIALYIDIHLHCQ